MNTVLHRTLSLSLAAIVTMLTFAGIEALATAPAADAMLAQGAPVERV